MKEIRDRLQEALQVRDMLPVELANKSGINKGAISRYLKGTVIPKQSAIGAMAKALSVSPAWLMGYDLNMDGTEKRTDTLPGGGFHGGEPRPDILIDFDQLSDKNKEQAMTYIKYLLETQKGEEKA